MFPSGEVVIVMTGLYSGPLIAKGPGVATGATGPVIGGISWPGGVDVEGFQRSLGSVVELTDCSDLFH